MEEQQQQQPQQRKGPIPLDLDTLLDDTPAAELVVKPSATAFDQEPQSFVAGLKDLKDYELEDHIRRKKNTLNTVGRNTPDGGAKLRAIIRCYEEEVNRRKVNPPPQKDDEKKATTSSNAVGVSNKPRQENFPSRPQSEPSFTTCFMKKLDDKTNCTAVDAFSDEKQHFKHCNNQTVRPNGEHKRRKRYRSSSRQLPFKCPRKLSIPDTFSDDKRCQANSVLSLQTVTRNLERRYSKDKGASQAIQSDGSRSRKCQPIVVDDDDDDDEDDDDDSEDPHILERTENKVPEYLKEAKVYFPSRDDPECVEICYNDMECLAPEGYLTSTIMNFYMRYLQQRVSLTILDCCQFFNTYFYKKLTEAVSCKESSSRQTIFAKFRRWWKGVNIFQKAYVLIPVHQDLHWSLIIICIPDKEDESGPIILHLDSLGLHSSKSVFDNIRSYLIEERNYLNRECASSDVPIADKIWRSLSRRIETQVIPVPQQKNEYDCGLFVLYFIQRFMEEAPERLKKKDLAMFSKRWFKPEEASNLRAKIHNLLVAELHNSIKPDAITSSPSSAVSATECLETTKDSSIKDVIMSCDPDIIE
ncbi:Ulp1 peptidase [Trifolium repens]|nr:Cysteine proteinases superfamily protein [Trifolium repens]WJX87862.1 Ulp1 peptidase [Trifolium repens]